MIAYDYIKRTLLKKLIRKKKTRLISFIFTALLCVWGGGFQYLSSPTRDGTQSPSSENTES